MVEEAAVPLDRLSAASTLKFGSDAVVIEGARERLFIGANSVEVTISCALLEYESIISCGESWVSLMTEMELFWSDDDDIDGETPPPPPNLSWILLLAVAFGEGENLLLFRENIFAAGEVGGDDDCDMTPLPRVGEVGEVGDDIEFKRSIFAL